MLVVTEVRDTILDDTTPRTALLSYCRCCREDDRVKGKPSTTSHLLAAALQLARAETSSFN